MSTAHADDLHRSAATSRAPSQDADPPQATARRGRWVPRGSQLAAWAFLAPVVVYLGAFYAYPLYRNVDLSVRHYTVRSFVQGGAPFSGWDNFRQVIDNPTFDTALRNTMVFTLVSILFQYVLGLSLAVFFHRGFRLAPTLRALFLIPWLLPLIVSASTWSWMFNSESGVVNYGLHLVGVGKVDWLTSPHWALTSVIIANIWIGIPFNLVILYSGLQNIPAELYEAASLDGATGWQQFRRITFPLLRPVSAITVLLGLIYTLKVFDLIWIMTRGGPGDSSTTLSTWSYRYGFGSLLPDFGPGAAVGNILILIALAFGLFYIRLQRSQPA
ncbi:sugar ABC transporter permease [Streptomyces cocklensis]|jgi:multiple sugar transport system permease protein|uniref:Carbohydrate ABC transporter membrane protein 1, CUT1 family n=1 Tax=Actinacidiphila cocklensis TaxID=887465 RepID=A0A9W4DRL2_9ACTN|nr:sugar ABC transporter permease [Actinacidiphila cocklensis]MDD1062152.1 sugar ABC transporter permease [Actinacidiphila cocklensis]WSX74558.1 sugar ABC transporter permease [Streptomyces sp. NBC_00899]CAG6396402.1 Carbohydrate ABC transporter membrane protein 1, CUT1 family [Actinacidiphila cocklensis]